MATRHAPEACEQSLIFLARPPPNNFRATVVLSCEGKEKEVGGGEGEGEGEGLISYDTREGATYWNRHSFRFKALLRIKAKNSPEINVHNFCY